MDITVLHDHGLATAAEADYLRVRVFPGPDKKTPTLATIERIVDKPGEQLRCRGPHVKKLVEKQPMSREAALTFARLYAARKRIRLVLTSS